MKQIIAVCLCAGLVFGNINMVMADTTASDQVKTVQQALNDAGYDCGAADGLAGKKTVEAIKAFETDHGLTADGVIDEALLGALGIASEVPSSAEDGAPEEEAKEKIDYDSLSTSQKNAVKEAKSYLEYTAFSRNGLIHQLSSEYGSGFPEEDAAIAVDYLEQEELVDWDEQAVLEAENYLDYSSFSRAGLIQQLSSEYGSEFTEEQAEKAVTYLEEEGLVDWFEQAVLEAENYLEYTSFSRSGLIEQLSSEYGSGFTYEQAEYAAQQVYD